MITVQRPQLDAMSDNLARLDDEELVKRLAADYPEQGREIGVQGLRERVAAGREDARGLLILEKEDIYRFLCLGFLPPEVLASKTTQSLLIRILNNVDLDSAKRLDFIQRHVLDRDSTDCND